MATQYGALEAGGALSPRATGPDSDPTGDSSSDTTLGAMSETAVRHGFIRKVYGIVGAQLFLTTLIAGILIRLGDTLIHVHPTVAMVLMFVSLAGSISLMCVFACYPQTMRRSPTNYIILLLFTLCEAVLIGFICLNYTLNSILVAVGVTAFIVLSMTLFACQTKVDFTGFGPYLFAASMCLMGFGFLFMIGSMAGLGAMPAFQTLNLVYACAGALLFSFYIVFDTQLIVGGKYHMQFSVDDYAAAAINLYIDIIQVFLFILRILGERRR